MSLKKIGGAILDILYPPDMVCAICLKEADVNESGLCASCAEKLVSAPDADELRGHAPYVDDIYAAVKYKAGKVPKAVRAMKYNGKTWLAVKLADFMEIDREWNADFITAVPIHKSRMRVRGYSQAARLAKTIADREGIPYVRNAIKKVRPTPQQAGRSRKERLEMQVGAFTADAKLCAGKRIIIVDDIFTTGATVNECARVLKEAGAEAVFAVAFAHG